MMGRKRFRRCDFAVFGSALLCLLLSLAPFPAFAADAPNAPATATAAAPPEVRIEGARATLSAAQTHNGSILLVDVELSGPLAQAPVHAHLGDRDYPLYRVPGAPAGRWEGVVGVSFLHKPGPAKVQVSVGEGEGAQTLELPFEVTEGPYRSEVLKVPPRTVSPRPRDLKRIRKESAAIRKIYRETRLEKLWAGPFVLPVNSSVTSPFGTKRVYNGQMQSFHQGLDLKARMGTPLRAPAGGVVVMARNLFFTGNTVILDHGYGVYTVYGHMSRLKVKVGARVKTGDVLGLAGMTGRANGPHLHWGAVIRQEKVNPMDLTRVMK
jgi:murein DD-endopeptidase MepM/ murein hydrolase activator NlpD